MQQKTAVKVSMQTWVHISDTCMDKQTCWEGLTQCLYGSMSHRAISSEMSHQSHIYTQRVRASRNPPIAASPWNFRSLKCVLLWQAAWDESLHIRICWLGLYNFSPNKFKAFEKTWEAFCPFWSEIALHKCFFNKEGGMGDWNTRGRGN